MSIYIGFYSIILLFALNKKLRGVKELTTLLLISLCVFLCFGYMTGSDWRAYEQIYNSLDYSTLFNHMKGMEFGYPVLQIAFKTLGFNFWFFFIIIKISCFLITIKTLKKYSNNNYIWGLLIFYSLFALDAYIDNPMRNLIASVIFMLSFRLIIERKIIKYIILIIIASSFHMSALIMFPVYFIYNMKLTPKLIIITLSIIIVFTIISQSVFRSILFDLIWSSDNFIGSRFNYNYLHETFYEDKQSLVTVGFLIHYVLFFLILLKQKDLEKLKYGHLIFNLTFVYMILYTLSFSIWILFRMRYFVFIPFSISVSYLPLLYKRHYLKILSIAIILVASFFTMKSTITRSYKYIPYTNHLEYLFKTSPSFYERSNYNYEHSPYANQDLKQ